MAVKRSNRFRWPYILELNLVMCMFGLSVTGQSFLRPRSPPIRTQLSYDLNDNTPSGSLIGQIGFDSGLYCCDTSENVDSGTGNHRATADDSATQTTLFSMRISRPLQVSPQSASLPIDFGKLIRIDPTTGSLYAATAIDRDVICAEQSTCGVELNVQARRITPDQRVTVVKVVLTIGDVNDNAPTFGMDVGAGVGYRPDTVNRHHVIVVSESSVIGARVAQLPSARDVDSPDNGIHHYDVMTSDSQPHASKAEDIFSVQMDDDDVWLVLRSALDRETQDSYQFKLIAVDSGTPQLSGTTSIRVEVADANDNPPMFDRSVYDVLVSEDTAVGTDILTVRATDPDIGANGEIVYFLKRKIRKSSYYSPDGLDDMPPFVIDPASGTISISGALDFESVQVYELIVGAENSVGMASGASGNTASAKVIISVVDVNDVVPTVTFRGMLEDDVTLDEINVPESLPVGSFVAHVAANDPDPVDGTMDCALDDDSSFQLIEIFKAEYQLITTRQLDRETQDKYQLLVTCRDSLESPLNGSAWLSINVDDVNDNPPSFPVAMYTSSVTENQPAGTRVIQLTASDVDIGANAVIEYRLPNGDLMANYFQLDPTFGLLTTAVSLDREEASTIQLTVLAVDGGIPSLTSSVTVVVVVGDVDDEKPRFIQEDYTFTIVEEIHSIVDTPIGRVTAIDADLPPFNNITYFADSHVHPIRVGNNDGTIFAVRPVDREMTPDFRFSVRACSPGGSYCDMANVHVRVLDVNDNDPVFLFPVQSNDTVQVSTNFRPDEDAVAQLMALDADIGENGLIEYHLASSFDDGASETQKTSSAAMLGSYFRLDKHTGELFSRCETLHPGTYALPVAAVDGGMRRADAVLYVVVNASIPFSGVGFPAGYSHSQSSAAFISGGYLTLVIIIGGTTCPIVALLLTAIGVIARRRDRQREGISTTRSRTGEIYFRKSSLGPPPVISIVPRSPTATEGSPEEGGAGPEYATLIGRPGRVRLSYASCGLNADDGSKMAADRLSLKRSCGLLAATSRTSLHDGGNCRNIGSLASSRSRTSLFNSPCSVAGGRQSHHGGRFNDVIDDVYSAEAAVTLDAMESTVAVPSSDNDVADSGRGSSEEVSYRNGITDVPNPSDSVLKNCDRFNGSSSRDCCWSAAAADQRLNDLSGLGRLMQRNQKQTTSDVPDRHGSRSPSDLSSWPAPTLVTFTSSPLSQRKVVDPKDSERLPALSSHCVTSSSLAKPGSRGLLYYTDCGQQYCYDSGLVDTTTGLVAPVTGGQHSGFGPLLPTYDSYV